MKKFKYKLALGDCLKKMDLIKDASVDLVVTDPPYGTTAASWDKRVDFEQYWIQVNRILNGIGTVIMTASQPFTTQLISSNLVQFKYCLVWEKSRGSNFVHAKFQPLKTHEDIVLFSKGGSAQGSKTPMVYNPQFTEGKPYKRTNNRNSTKPLETLSGGKVHSAISHHDNSDGKRTPRSVLYHIVASDADGTFHSTQKPVSLMEYLIKQYSNENSIIVDPFMGSGSTGVACMNTGRRFIGIEKEEHYYLIALKRIKEAAKPKRTLFE